MAQRHSEYARDNLEWYVEPEWVADDLFKKVKFSGKIHDPCCGLGTIPGAARRAGYTASGSDIADRGEGYPVTNYEQDPKTYDNIVTNPPYKQTVRIFEWASLHTSSPGKIAMIVPIGFLCSQSRFHLWRWVETVIIYSRRPSMPPGEILEALGESCRKGGSTDYCWIVWNFAYNGQPTIQWSLGK